MRFSEIPERLLPNRTAIRVLRVLLTYPEREMTGRQIAALAGAPPARVIERLRVLDYEGLAERRILGKAHVWRLVKGHVLVPHLTALFRIESASGVELRRALGAWVTSLEGVTEARLYGSVARGDERPDSDVDVLLLVADGRAKRAAERSKAAIEDDVRARFGNSLSVRVLTLREARRRPRRGFLPSALREGEVLDIARGGGRNRSKGVGTGT
jgi:predicted nucleotidyltransferase